MTTKQQENVEYHVSRLARRMVEDIDPENILSNHQRLQLTVSILTLLYDEWPGSVWRALEMSREGKS